MRNRNKNKKHTEFWGWKYLHLDRQIPKKMLRKCRNMWNRHNCDWDEDRMMRNRTRDRISREDMNEELKNRIDGTTED